MYTQDDKIIEQRPPVCLMCKNYIKGWKCKAFNTIPINILRGEDGHEKPLPEQTNDIIFEEKEPDEN